MKCLALDCDSDAAVGSNYCLPHKLEFMNRDRGFIYRRSGHSRTAGKIITSSSGRILRPGNTAFLDIPSKEDSETSAKKDGISYTGTKYTVRINPGTTSANAGKLYRILRTDRQFAATKGPSVDAEKPKTIKRKSGIYLVSEIITRKL